MCRYTGIYNIKITGKGWT